MKEPEVVTDEDEVVSVGGDETYVFEELVDWALERKYGALDLGNCLADGTLLRFFRVLDNIVYQSPD